MDDMLGTMYNATGIGLAAIQIGIPKRVVVMDISKNEKELILCKSKDNLEIRFKFNL